MYLKNSLQFYIRWIYIMALIIDMTVIIALVKLSTYRNVRQ